MVELINLKIMGILLKVVLKKVTVSLSLLFDQKVGHSKSASDGSSVGGSSSTKPSCYSDAPQQKQFMNATKMDQPSVVLTLVRVKVDISRELPRLGATKDEGSFSISKDGTVGIQGVIRYVIVLLWKLSLSWEGTQLVQPSIKQGLASFACS